MSFANAFGLNVVSKTLHELRKVSIVLSIRGLRVTPITEIRIQMWHIEVVAQIVSRVETTRLDQT